MKEKNAVAIRMRGRLVDYFPRLAIEVELLLMRRVGVGRPRVLRRGRLLAGGRAHPVEHALKRDHSGLVAGARADIAHDVTAGDCLTGRGDLLVAADGV